MTEVDTWYGGIVIMPRGVSIWDIEKVHIGGVFYCAAVMEPFGEDVVSCAYGG